MKKKKPPFQLLLDYLDIPIAKAAKEARISLRSAYRLLNGEPCGAKVWRALDARYAMAIKYLDLTSADFLYGKVGRR